MIRKLCIEALAVALMGPTTPGYVGENSLEELEIIAGAAWHAVGGVSDGSVEVKDVDPKRFGVETASATEVTWVASEEGMTKLSTLSTTRAFKPMDLIIVELQNNGDGTVDVVTGLTEIRSCDISGTNQFTSANAIPSQCFGSTLSAPRPKIRFDTVQTAPALTLLLAYRGGTIAPSASVRAIPVFSGVAVKR